MHHPWRVLGSLTEWTLHFADLPLGVMGTTCWRTKTITLARGLLQTERRCTIAHELEHVARGRPHPDAVLTARDEALVEQEAARRLISLHDLGEALAWAHNLDEAAEELWVDRATLEVRLRHARPAERAYLARRLNDDQ